MTASIITTSNVDTSKVEHTQLHTMCDAAENAASTVIRTVIVESHLLPQQAQLLLMKPDCKWNRLDNKEDQGSNVSIETAGEMEKHLRPCIMTRSMAKCSN